MNPGVQWITLFYMMLAGAAMGLAYDSYRVLSFKLRFPKWLNALLDFLYWVWAALFVFRMLYAGNQGELRFYAFLGLFIGVWIYFLIFSVTVRRFVVRLIHSVQYVYRLFWKVAGVVIGIPMLWLWHLVRGIAVLLGRILRFILKIILRLSKPIWVLPVRWISPHWKRIAGSARVTKLREWMKQLWKRRP